MAAATEKRRLSRDLMRSRSGEELGAGRCPACIPEHHGPLPKVYVIGRLYGSSERSSLPVTRSRKGKFVSLNPAILPTVLCTGQRRAGSGGQCGALQGLVLLPGRISLCDQRQRDEEQKL